MRRQERKIPPRLTIDREINDEDIWHIEIDDGKRIFRSPHRKTSLEQSFAISGRAWNCKVLKRFINGDPNVKEVYEER